MTTRGRHDVISHDISLSFMFTATTACRQTSLVGNTFMHHLCHPNLSFTRSLMPNAHDAQLAPRKRRKPAGDGIIVHSSSFTR